MEIKFKKLVQSAILPTQGKPGDAAFDLYCVAGFSLKAGETKAVSTGLQLADMPQSHPDGSGVFLQIEGRSSLALEGIFPLGGIIDATYRGEIKIILHNSKQNDYRVFKTGDRIAQLIVRKIVSDAKMLEVAEITQTVRGSSGFGSTGS